MIRSDETWQRLLRWTSGQTASERLSAQVLMNEGFAELDPSHPLGGKDGKRDAVCKRNGDRWIMACYFPRDQQNFPAIKAKFISDLEGVSANDAKGIAFVTNQELRLAERTELKELVGSSHVEIYHLERIAAILDQPAMAPVRKQFLGIGDDAPSIIFAGGGGGQAPGAGGGGGAAYGNNSKGGDGGPGGNIRVHGQDGQAPGAGGGGGAAFGDNLEGGSGGGGGEVVTAHFLASELPPVVEIKIGAGGRGGRPGENGRDGGDSSFGDLITAKGGKGGKAGKPLLAREVTALDVAEGLRVSGLSLTEFVYFRDGLLNLLYAGWDHARLEIPGPTEWAAVVSISMPHVANGTLLEFAALVRSPSGREVARQSFFVDRGELVGAAIRHWYGPLSFQVTEEGIWTVEIVSGGISLNAVSVNVSRPTSQ